MNTDFLELHQVSFAYDSQSESLIQDLSLQFASGWSGVVGANGVGKSTFLQLATGQVKPTKGTIRIPQVSVYCQQRTDTLPENFQAFIEDAHKTAHFLKGKLEIADDWLTRWDSLSHGERKRAQIGTALWMQPQLLAIDEPTNHLDYEAREILISALLSFNGIGLVVSHDKFLLDTLCSSCLFIDPPAFKLIPGNFSKGWIQLKREMKTQERQELLARKELKKLDRQILQYRSEAAQADRKRSKRGIDKKDHDAKSKLDLARLSGKDAVAGKLMNQLAGRRNQAQSRLASINLKKTYDTGIWQQGERTRRNFLFSLEAGQIDLGGNRVLKFPRLTMNPADRIALTGVNGSGKSTLIRHIVKALNIPVQRLTYMPQEVDRWQAESVLSEVKKLPHDQLGYVMTFVNRLGTRPPRLLESSEPSPGEIRKILLALGAVHVPHLLIMDEPTNHLDLISIECLKESLADFPAGLLLVSHDVAFLQELTELEWRIEVDKSAAQVCRLEVQ